MLIILLVCTLIVYSRALRSGELFLQAPTLVAFSYLLFLIPQMFAFEFLDIQASVLNPTAYVWTLLYAIICLVASYFGWQSGRFKGFYRSICRFSDRIEGQALFWTMFLLSMLSNFAAYQFAEIKAADGLQYEGGQQLTGTGTKILFFARLVYIPYAFFLSKLLKKQSIFNLILFIATAMLTFQRVFVGGRRSPLALLFLPLLCMLYFRKNITLGRVFIVLGIVVPLVLIPALATFRADFWSALIRGEIDLSFITKTVFAYFTQNYPYDFTNAVNIVSLTTERLFYGLGSGFWNDWVFNFVPAQFLGADFKDFLYIKISPVSYLKNAELITFFPYKLGTTQTGLGNTFAEFGFLGGGCFYVQSKVMRTFWDAAIEGKEFAMVAYCFLTTSIFLTVTHGFYYFVNYGFILLVTAILCRLLTVAFRKRKLYMGISS